MKSLYLALAILGAVIPYAFFFQYFVTEGVNLGRFAAAWFANPAAGGATADLLIASVVFWVFLFHQWLRDKGPAPYLYVALNLCIGLSCALPAYLYARERRSATSTRQPAETV